MKQLNYWYHLYNGLIYYGDYGETLSISNASCSFSDWFLFSLVDSVTLDCFSRLEDFETPLWINGGKTTFFFLRLTPSVERERVKKSEGYLKNKVERSLAMFWSHCSFVSYLSVKFLFDVLSPSPHYEFSLLFLHNLSFQNVPPFFFLIFPIRAIIVNYSCSHRL